jgi:hypothetical protein
MTSSVCFVCLLSTNNCAKASASLVSRFSVVEFFFCFFLFFVCIFSPFWSLLVHNSLLQSETKNQKKEETEKEIEPNDETTQDGVEWVCGQGEGLRCGKLEEHPFLYLSFRCAAKCSPGPKGVGHLLQWTRKPCKL